jgi:hypothetical protein
MRARIVQRNTEQSHHRPWLPRGQNQNIFEKSNI